MATAKNQLLMRLSGKDRQSLLSHCESVNLVLSDVLCEPGTPFKHVYFPTDGFISLVAIVDGSPGVEVGMVGSEGMLGAQMALGVSTAPWHAVVQGPGAAWRIPTAAFKRQLAGAPSLQRAMNRYLYVLMAQQANAAACLRFHLIGPRLARWLLMSQDRAHSSSFHVTHEFLAYMLGMRRVGITAAASALQRSGLITYHRGDLTVLDRSGLENVACTCYVSDRAAYAHLLG